MSIPAKHFKWYLNMLKNERGLIYTWKKLCDGCYLINEFLYVWPETKTYHDQLLNEFGSYAHLIHVLEDKYI